MSGCEFVGKSDGDRGRCGAEAGGFNPKSNGMDLLPYCVDCGANFCEHHLARHRCGAMVRAGTKRGDAPARYREEMDD
ncbi:hypothetical protein LCGC14_0273790 [marine sediment metagenome]|uniref:Uncharacterized protein n=1 Tax=marine sediment metagenome TaxID=412755 RepID=A0A0F9UF18_9ZZZZ